MNANRSRSALDLSIQHNEPTFCALSITVPSNLVDALYEQTVAIQKKATPTFGFHKRETPADYIEQNYQQNLADHVQEFLLRYLVLGHLYEEIRHKKILIAGTPRLKSIDMRHNHDAQFNFELSLFPAINFQEWKYLPFKAPKRKNYKDLDRQVETFLQEELSAKDAYDEKKGIGVGDWVNYTLTVLNQDMHPLLDTYAANLWIKIGDEEPDKPFHELFLHKTNKTCFTSSNPILQDYFVEPLNAHYAFAITIDDIVPHQYFCLDQFKQQFRLKNNKEMYQKLIEVFSYRNDLSQRRTMVEESLKLLLSKHRYEIPNHLILRQQKNVLEAIQHNPDYHVYRVQKDFKDAIRELAEKQAREEIFLDQLAYEEDLRINHNDIKNYLNLTQRQRTREYLHFDPPIIKTRTHGFPILNEELAGICLREKTVNHIIYHLTKK